MTRNAIDGYDAASEPLSDAAARARAERQAAYDEAIQMVNPFGWNGLRRFGTTDRDVQSWPLFVAWTAGVAVLYYVIGARYWEGFRNPETGTFDPLLFIVYLVFCASIVWFCWPLPKRKN